jgi:methionyl-tRNA formyltransferase
MRILFVTQKEPFYIKSFFSCFLKNHNHYIAGIVLQDTFGRRKTHVAKKAFEFYGPVGFLYMSCKYAGIKLSDAASRVTNVYFDLSIEQLARKYSVPILPFKSVNSPRFIEFVSSNQIDVIVSVAASEIFGESVLAAPRFGCINIHSSPLPKYRGMMPNFWILYNNEKNAWVTIHRMVKELDAGPIMFQDKFEIRKSESYNSLSKRSKQFAAGALLKVLSQLEQGKVQYSDNDPKQATYYTFPTRKHIKLVKSRGGRIL